MNKEVFMKSIIFMAILLLPFFECFGSQPPKKTSSKITKQGLSVETWQASQEIDNAVFGKIKKSVIQIFHSDNIHGKNKKEVGKAVLRFVVKQKRATIVGLDINHTFRNQSLGSFLFKYTIAYIQKNIPCTKIDWEASPSDGTPLARLVAFYSNSGGIDIEKSKKYSTEMQYSLPSAQMLVALMPILEPILLSKDDKTIILANGEKYISSPSNILGIIANYMGEKNE